MKNRVTHFYIMNVFFSEKTVGVQCISSVSQPSVSFMNKFISFVIAPFHSVMFSMFFHARDLKWLVPSYKWLAKTEDKRREWEKKQKKQPPQADWRQTHICLSHGDTLSSTSGSPALDPYISLCAAVFPSNLTLFLAASWQYACGPPQGKVWHLKSPSRSGSHRGQPIAGLQCLPRQILAE